MCRSRRRAAPSETQRMPSGATWRRSRTAFERTANFTDGPSFGAALFLARLRRRSERSHRCAELSASCVKRRVCHGCSEVARKCAPLSLRRARRRGSWSRRGGRCGSPDSDGQLLDLFFGQVLADSQISIRPVLGRLGCSFYGARSDQFEMRFCHRNSPPLRSAVRIMVAAGDRSWSGVLAAMVEIFGRLSCATYLSSLSFVFAAHTQKLRPFFRRRCRLSIQTRSRTRARERTCLDQYMTNKATNGNDGLVWQRKGGGYYSECKKRLK